MVSFRPASRALLLIAFAAASAAAQTDFPVVEAKGGVDVRAMVSANSMVLLEFYAPWCEHCKKFSPIYENISARLGSDNIVVARVDGSKFEGLTGMYDVDSYPTILALKHDLPAVLYDGSFDFEEVVAFALKMHKASPVELKQPSDADAYNFFNGPSLLIYDALHRPELIHDAIIDVAWSEAGANSENAVLDSPARFFYTTDKDTIRYLCADDSLAEEKCLFASVRGQSSITAQDTFAGTEEIPQCLPCGENQDDVDVAEQNSITFEYEELKGYFKALSLTMPRVNTWPPFQRELTTMSQLADVTSYDKIIIAYAPSESHEAEEYPEEDFDDDADDYNDDDYDDDGYDDALDPLEEAELKEYIRSVEGTNDGKDYCGLAKSKLDTVTTLDAAFSVTTSYVICGFDALLLRELVHHTAFDIDVPFALVLTSDESNTFEEGEVPIYGKMAASETLFDERDDSLENLLKSTLDPDVDLDLTEAVLVTYETVYDEEMTYKDDLLSISEYGPYDDDDYDEDHIDGYDDGYDGEEEGADGANEAADAPLEANARAVRKEECDDDQTDDQTENHTEEPSVDESQEDSKAEAESEKRGDHGETDSPESGSIFSFFSSFF